MPRESGYSVGVQSGCRSAVESRLRVREPASRGTIEVGEFSLRQHSSLIESRTFIRAGFAAVTTLLHLGLLTAAVWPGSRESAHAHPLEGATAPRGPAIDDIALTWVAVDEHTAADSSRSAPAVLQSPRLIPIVETAPALEFAVNWPEVAPGEAHPSGANDSDSRARIYGLYLGQINARIDRAWIRPHSLIGAMVFLCQVLIEQDAVGNVEEVTLDRCNGTPNWQRSLIDAVKSASPLPAPADPAVFAPKIQMAFHEEAHEEAATAGPDGTAPTVKLSINSPGATNSPASLRQIRNMRVHAGGAPAIDLRIEGRAAQQERLPPAVELPLSAPPRIGLNAETLEAGGTP